MTTKGLLGDLAAWRFLRLLLFRRLVEDLVGRLDELVVVRRLDLFGLLHHLAVIADGFLVEREGGRGSGRRCGLLATRCLSGGLLRNRRQSLLRASRSRGGCGGLHSCGLLAARCLSGALLPILRQKI